MPTGRHQLDWGHPCGKRYKISSFLRNQRTRVMSSHPWGKYGSRTMIAFTVLWLCGHLLSSCGQAGHSYYPDDAWRTSTPEEQGVDSKYLVAMLRKIQSEKLDFHSLLIIRNGYMIAEVYWAPYHRETTHDIKSASKSIMSSLVGIALEKQYLKGLDQKVAEFFPEYVNEPLKKDISLHDLLTMKSGLKWQEDAGPSPFDIETGKRSP
jgi:CubicO group peptidase (beta-lactamase class C family)